MFRFTFFTFILFNLPVIIFGQTINTDRPGMGYSPVTLRKHQVNFEIGWLSQKQHYTRYVDPRYYPSYNALDDIDESDNIFTYAFRMGLTDWLEFRLTPTEYYIHRWIHNGTLTGTQDQITSGMGNVTTGFKIGIFNQPDKKFHLSVMPEYSIMAPTSREYSYLLFSVNAGYTISDIFSVNTTITASDIDFTSLENPVSNYLMALIVNYTFSDKLSFFVQPYAYTYPFYKSQLDWYINFGALYLINPTWQIDASLGYGQDIAFTNLGVSKLFDANNKQ